VADLVSGHPVPELAEFGPTRFERGAALRAGFGEARILG
jgi:hypothetical protein